MKEQLQELRKAKRLTQEQISAIVDVKLSTYQKYERDATAPPYDVLVRIADFYNVSTDYLLGRTPIKQMATEQPDPFASIDISAVEKRIITMYTALDEDMRAICIEAFRQLSKAIEDDSDK